MPVEAEQIEAARAFTRAFTREVELLDEGLHASRFSLTESRVLYELAYRRDATASELARELGLDAGYLSRILKRFEAETLVARSPSDQDGRQSRIVLTGAGHAAFAPLDAASREAWASRLESLRAEGRRELVGAMASVARLLGGSRQPGEITLRPHRIGDLGAVAQRQGIVYAREYGWDGTYEALAAEILAGFVRQQDPARERGWIAERDGTMLGSCFLMRASDETAKLRLLYVEPEARGTGLGARLVDECIAAARAAGYGTLTLWTNDCLVAARRIYERAGFALTGEEPHRSFGHDLVGQTWSLTL